MIKMLPVYSIVQGLLFALIFNGYIFIVMLIFSPRIWGYQDYSEEIKTKVPPQTRQERKTAILISIPFFLIIFGLPVYSLLTLKARLGGDLPFLTAFVHLLILFIFGTLGDLVILDWLIISKITPKFIIIPGTKEEDYKDFSHHYKGHALATIPMILICAIVAAIISYL